MLQYQTTVGRGELTARLDVFNIFDFDDWVSVDESADDGNSCPPVSCGGTGFEVNPSFGLPQDFQRPRVVRVGVTYDF